VIARHWALAARDRGSSTDGVIAYVAKDWFSFADRSSVAKRFARLRGVHDQSDREAGAHV